MANAFLRLSALVAAGFVVAVVYMRLPGFHSREPALCEHCNVVLISFDTVRADHLGAYGYARGTSPNVDALARKSLVFERAISQAPWTLPAHGSMLSGLYPSRLGVAHYPAIRRLPDQNSVLPEVFHAAGYATAGFTGGGFVSANYGFNRGFDIYASSGRRFEHNIDATIDWLDQHKRKPFFLFFHGYDAHRPYYSSAVDKAAMELPSGARSDLGGYCLRDDREVPGPARRDEIVRYYDAAIHHGDRAIGVLLDALEQMRLMDKTLILLTSDHGEEFFEHGHCDHVRFLYNESVHVPYMIYVPGLTPGGRRIDGLLPASISIAQTLLDAVGIEHHMPGETLLPMIAGKQADFPVVYSETDSKVGALGSRGRSLAIIKPDLKLIAYTEENAYEGYDHSQDPDELQPLPEGHAVYQMAKPLRAWADAISPLPRPAKRPDSKAAAAAPGRGKDAGKPRGPRKSKDKGMKVPKDLKENLKSLGYLE